MKKIVFTTLLITILTHCFAQEYKEDPIVYNDGVYSYTELGKVCYDGDFEEVKNLIKKGFNTRQCVCDDYMFFDLIWIAISRQNENMLVKLIDYGIEPTALYSEEGLNAISLAIWTGDDIFAHKVIKLLLSKGLNINGVYYKDYEYHKYIDNIIYPLIEAIKFNSIEVVKLLIDNGADLSLPGNGISALDVAKEYKRTEIEIIISQAKKHNEN